MSRSSSELLDDDFEFLFVSSAVSSESAVLVCDVTYRKTLRAFRSPCDSSFPCDMICLSQACSIGVGSSTSSCGLFFGESSIAFGRCGGGEMSRARLLR